MAVEPADRRQTVGVDRVFELAASFGLGYFFGLGAMALTHYLVAWPGSYDEASVLALVPGASALLTRLAAERRARQAPSGDDPSAEIRTRRRSP